MTEAPGRDPLNEAAEEAATLFAEKQASSAMDWNQFVKALGYSAEKAQRRYLLAQRLQAAFAADGGQLPLIPDARLQEPKQSRAKRRVLMHETADGDFACPKCFGASPIPADMTEAARKRGIPCPRCNQDQPGIAQDENAASEKCDCVEPS